MNRDMMDTIVKMNLSIKARQTCEQALDVLNDNLLDKEKENNTFENKFKKQEEDLIRLTDLNDEYKKKIIEQDDNMDSVKTIQIQELKLSEYKLSEAYEMFNREANNSMNTMKLFEDIKKEKAAIYKKMFVAEKKQMDYEVQSTKHLTETVVLRELYQQLEER